MLRKEDWMKIQEKIARGVYRKDIADELGVHPRTISRALKRGGAPEGKKEPPGRSKLDDYKPFIDSLLQDGVWNSQVILRRIQEKGYTGGATILRDYIRPKRPLRTGRATVRFETEPGVQLQNDWGELITRVGGEPRKVYFSVNTLGYSRRFHFWCAWRNDAEHTCEGIIRAMEYFGGGCREVLVDNQKAAVLHHRPGQPVVYNSRFIDFAAHYGFHPRACRPGRARTKGKDERMVGYIKHNFFLRHREFDSLSHMNALAVKWLSEEADLRFHGTVKEVVRERFAREAPHLLPLPPVRYDTSYLKYQTVSWDSYVHVEGNRYSVPSAYCGQQVMIRQGLDGGIRVYAGGDLVAEHQWKDSRQGWSTIAEHHSRLWEQALTVERRDLSVYEEVARCS